MNCLQTTTQPKTQIVGAVRASALAALLFAGCASTEMAPSEATYVIPAPPPLVAPKWTRGLVPSDRDTIYTLGSAQKSATLDDALERAWISALLRMGMNEFPELGVLSYQSFESLHDASSKRRYVLALEKIRWQGIQEATDRGSPHVEYHSDSGTYSAYRLLKWDRANLKAAKAQIKLAKSNPIPLSPELQAAGEAGLIEGVQKMRTISRAIASKDDLVQMVLAEARCGISIDDLTAALGPAEHYDLRDNSQIVAYWGTYEFKQYKSKGSISVIRTGRGNGSYLKWCD